MTNFRKCIMKESNRMFVLFAAFFGHRLTSLFKFKRTLLVSSKVQILTRTKVTRTCSWTIKEEMPSCR